MFSVEDKLGLLQEETLAVFYIRMLRETVRQRGKKMEDARKSRLEQASSSVPKVKKQTDVKGLYSLKASPATKAENSLSVAGKMKNVVVRLSTSSRVSWWQVWKQMHSWLFRHADGERKPSARSIRRYSRKSCYYQKKKKVQGCVSQNSDPMNSILRKAWELGLNASAGHNWKFSGCIWCKTEFGKEKAIWRHYPKRWTSWAKSLRAWFSGTSTWGNLTTSRLYQQSSVEFGEKICKLKPKTTTFHSLVKAPETHKRVCLFVVDSGGFNAQCWARRIELRYNGYFDKVQNPISDLPRSGAVQLNE